MVYGWWRHHGVWVMEMPYVWMRSTGWLQAHQLGLELLVARWSWMMWAWWWRGSWARTLT
jgi:hypothetical protein